MLLEDDYFVSRRPPQIDFYSGLIYESMGSRDMFTVLFAIGHPGWLAHWDEMLSQNSRIARPRQLYTGSGEATSSPSQIFGTRPERRYGAITSMTSLPALAFCPIRMCAAAMSSIE